MEELVKITVVTNDTQLVLTRMGDKDLETIANIIHNKMIVLDSDFEEDVEYREF